MRLNDWQLSLEAYLLDSQGQPTPALLASLQGSESLSAQAGLAIYHNAYRMRLQEALRGDFPALLQCLGEQAFDSLSSAYLQVNPSQHFSLRWLGAGFADFIDEPAWAELARLEWAFTLAFDAPAGAPLTLEQMARLPPGEWPNLQVRCIPSVQCLRLAFNSLALWRAHKNAEAMPGSERLATEQVCLVWRQGLQGQFRTLLAAEAEAYAGMTEQGWTFAELCLSQAHLGEAAAAQAAGWLKQWLSEGLLQRVNLYG